MIRFRLHAILFLLFIPAVVVGQDFDLMRQEARKRQAEARAEIDKLTREIQRVERQISEAGNRHDQLHTQFQSLRREIALRNEVLRKLSMELNELAEAMRITQKQVEQEQARLDALIASYKSNLRYLYMHGRVPDLAYILSASSVKQMMTRSYYLKRFETRRQDQASQIRESQALLALRIAEIEQTRQENRKNLAQTESERKRMESRSEDQQRTITTLQRDRRNLQRRLDDTRRQVRELTRVIEQAIAEEERIQRAEAQRLAELEAERLRRLAEARRITDAKEREEAVARYSSPTSRTAATPDATAIAALENSFENLRGRMRWPVNQGAVAVPFGNITDPVYKTVTYNPGLEIASGSREPVYAIHDGYTGSSDHLIIPGFDNTLILYHGKYKSIYGNLSEVLVGPNTYVRAGDLIGYGGTERSPKGESVFLMIKRGQDTVDPSAWIQPRQTRNP
jgi:septal ring factor EnvC (AmiA/AmiB activator)